MNLIDAHRRLTVCRRTRAASVRPALQAMDNGGRPRRPLGREGIRVCLELDAAVARLDFVFVERPRRHVGKEYIPESGSRMKLHRVTAAIPVVEVADHAHAPRVRRPYDKGGTLDTVHHGRVCTHLLEAAPI